MMIWKLEPRANFHLGEKEGVLESTSDYIHSDTLFSAISHAYRLLYGNKELNELLNDFNNRDPPFLISSAFFYAGEILTFPLPLSINWGDYIDDRLIEALNTGRKSEEKIDRFDLLKRLNRVRFVSESIFWDIVKEESRIKNYINESNIVQGILFSDEELGRLRKQLGVEENEDIRIINRREVPRVAIDRRANVSHIYHFGEVSFAKGCGLYFMMDMRKREYEREVKAAIRILGDEGIGGDRTCGKGLFKAKCESKDMDMNLKSANHFVTLSLYYPMKEELKSMENSYYELIRRGGWIYSLDAMDIRRRVVRMFSEGSVFKTVNGRELYGGMADVKPKGFEKHGVYRYGFAFAVPLVKQR